MFQNLRAGTPLYVLHKKEPKIEQGEVIFVSNPVPQFGQTTFNAGIMAQQPMTVDVKIKNGDQTIELQKLPATLSIADYGNGMVVSENRDAIINEIGVLKNTSQKIIESIGYHKEMVKKCDLLLEELNPQIRQEAERSRELESISTRVSGLENSLERIEEMLARSLNTKKGN